MGQMPARNAFSTTNFVCCKGPSLASTNSTAPSTMPSILQEICGSLSSKSLSPKMIVPLQPHRGCMQHAVQNPPHARRMLASPVLAL